MIEINLTDLEIMIGPLKPQEITPEVTLEENIPKIIKTSMITTLILDNIIQEIIQKVTPEGDPQMATIGHIVKIRTKDINIGAHSANMTILGIHTQPEIITDQERDSEMDHTIDPERYSEIDHTKDPERDSEMDHTIDPEEDSEMDHTIDPERDSEMDHTIDPKRDSEITHRKDMRIIMIKEINLKKETPHIQKKCLQTQEPIQKRKKPLIF